MMERCLEKSLIGLFFVLVVGTQVNSYENEPSYLGDWNVSEVLDSMMKGYDRRIRPDFGGPPVNVSITMYVLSVTEFCDSQMHFTADFYFRQFWKDSRLKFTPKNNIKRLTLGASFLNQIWVPDTFFVNEKKSYYHTVTEPNEFVRIQHEGEILRSTRFTVTASCPMNLQYFPMDRQLCTIEIESFAYSMNDIWYQWLENEKQSSPIGMSREVSLPQWRVLGYRKKSKEAHLYTGNYSRLACEIQFVRSYGYYLKQMYIPAGLIVIISWVSFWLNRNAVSSRVAIGLTTLLAIMILTFFANESMPKISYTNAIEEYMGTCFAMVAASLLEFATVSYLGKRIQLKKSRANLKSMKASSIKQNPTELENEAEEDEVCGDQDKMYGMKPSDIDKYSRIVFPILFICFNLIYWIKFIYVSDVEADDLTYLHSY